MLIISIHGAHIRNAEYYVMDVIDIFPPSNVMDVQFKLINIGNIMNSQQC